MKRILAITLFAALSLGALIPAKSFAAVPPQQSDNNLRWARAHVERDIDMLQRDQRDYGGHRVKAIEDFQSARTQLTLGLTYDGSHDYSIPMPVVPNFAVSNNRSDANLLYVRADVEHVLDVLQRDNTDYGGHRVAAIALLQQGRQQILAALAWDRNH